MNHNEDELAQRWLTESGKRTRERVIHLLSSTTPPTPAEFGALVAEIASIDSPRDFDIRGIDLSGVAIRSPCLMHFVADGAILDRCDFSGAAMQCATLIGASLVGARLNRAMMTDVVARHANFDDATLLDTDLTGARLCATSMQRAVLRNAWLVNADLSDANLTDADVAGASFSGATVDRARMPAPAWADVCCALAASLPRGRRSAISVHGLPFAERAVIRRSLIGAGLASVADERSPYGDEIVVFGVKG